MAIEAMYPGKRMIHLFLDNARYHHAKLVQAWLARPGCRIELHFIPSYCPHLDSIERLWGLMHKHITHNRCYETFRDFSNTSLAIESEMFGQPTLRAKWKKEYGGRPEDIQDLQSRSMSHGSGTGFYLS